MPSFDCSAPLWISEQVFDDIYMGVPTTTSVAFKPVSATYSVARFLRFPMMEEPPSSIDSDEPQPYVIHRLGIGYEPLDDESSEEEVLNEESELTHEGIQESLSRLLTRPYEFQDFEEAHVILARVLSIISDEDPTAMLIYEIYDNLCRKHAQLRIQDTDNHIYSAPFIIQEKEDPETIYKLGHAFRIQYNRDGELNSLEASISSMKKVVHLAEETGHELPKYLFGLADALFEKFERFSGVESLDDGIECQRRAISLYPYPNPGDLANLGQSLLRRFQVTVQVADLEEAVEVQEQSVASVTDELEDAVICYSSLANSLVVRFEHQSRTSDLERAIELFERTLRLDLETEVRATIAHDAANALQLKCIHIIDIGSIDQAIQYQDETVRLTTDQNTEKPRRLTSLGYSLQIRFEHLGDISDIQRAISLQSTALELLPKRHIVRSNILNDLGRSYFLLFCDSGELKPLEKALAYYDEALRLVPMSSPDRIKYLFNKGHALREKFETHGKLPDIDHAIAVYSEAASFTSECHIDWAERLDHLGSAFLARSELLNGLVDLDNAIGYYRAALSIHGSGNKKAQATLNNLGIALRRRFFRLGRYSDIDESIYLFQGAIELSVKPSLTPVLLNSLSVSLWSRYNRTKQVEDMDESISCAERAIALAPHDHPDIPFWLNSLSNSLRAHYNHTGNMDDLNAAIESQKRAVHLLPEYHSERPGMLRSLGDVIRLRHGTTENHNRADWDEQIDAYRKAALSTVGRPYERFEAAYSWAESTLYRGGSPLEAYKFAFALIPQIVWMGSTIDERYYEVPPIGRLTTQAISHAISEGNYSLALEWFEESRSIVWRQILGLRTPLDELRVVDQSLAEKLQRVARALDRAGSSKSTRSVSKSTAKSLEQAAQSHHRLAEEWDRLLDEVRQVEGFSDFMRAKKAETLMKAAHDGPVVAINIHGVHCDALIIASRGTHLDHVPLPNLSYQKALDAQNKLMRSLSIAGVRDRTERRPIFEQGSPSKDNFGAILEFLWVNVVRPVLENLQYLDPEPGQELPHITWCVTGPLSFLPVHAAGRYVDPSPKSRIFNCVVSSYSPTISGLITSSTSLDNFSGILAIGQASTPGLSPLPGTKGELESIMRQAKSLRVTQLIDDSATPDTVLDELSTHSWVHFACHASQVPDDPTSSAFYLHDGTLDLSTIIRQPLGRKAFAFLSACQTATGDLDLPEEAVHLAAGMLMAGYPTVIATMWSIKDNDAPLIAEHTYAGLLKDGKPDSSKACHALHRALVVLRETVGENAFVSWVPYIHIGI
ncbi:unnamed protein product [Rhizoctonia solani]|uniref:CHAT domain-containing protein n=1 Tax=Rhizoctonia solani TaxID=456999 RepID=A0A8H3CAU7_9AGAM|nr:unnamed protein product [Rhizoctonia solani]